MTKRKKRACIAICVCSVAALTLTMGWFVSRFVPGTPKSPDPVVAQSHRSPNLGPWPATEDVVDIPFGATFAMEDLNQGKAYAREDFTDEEWASVPDDIKAYIEKRLPVLAVEANSDKPSGSSWRMDATWTLPVYSGLDVTVERTQAVSTEAFAEFYPAYLSSPDYRVTEERKVVLVDVVATNTTDSRTVAVPQFALWSPAFAYPENDHGYGIDKYLNGSLYPGNEDVAGKISNTTQEGWNELAPGETRRLTLSYLVRKADFADKDVYENMDLSKFCLEVFDYAPAVVCHRLWLG